jgi:hypothetical protein
MELSGYGIALSVPDQWDAIIYQREDGNAVVHATNFPLQVGDGDFASSSADAMPESGVLIVLFEYNASQASGALFSDSGLNEPLMTNEFTAGGVRRMLPGLTAAQRFFVDQDRPFTLYAVLGSSGQEALSEVNQVLASITMQPRVAPGP